MATRPETVRKILVYWMDGMVVLMGISLVILITVSVAEGRIGWAGAAVSAVCVVGVFVLFSVILRGAYDRRPRPTVKLALSGALTAVILLLLPPMTDGMTSWEGTAYFWLSAMVLYFPWWATVLSGAAVVAAISGLYAAAGLFWPGALVNQLAGAVMLPVATWLWRWLWWTIRDAHDSQAAKARLAVAEERLRFARDLHDLLGHSLSVITLKSELSAKLAVKDPARSAVEMADVRRLAGESLDEVRLAVDGYRSLDLDEELDRARAVLEAAGTRCVVEAGAGELSPAARALLAWVVREGTTNVLKHSSASRCAITLAGGVLEMRNDGVLGPVSGAGSGLRGLAERMAVEGGAFSAGPTGDGEFVLRAETPA